jgi:hypothetical protein
VPIFLTVSEFQSLPTLYAAVGLALRIDSTYTIVDAQRAIDKTAQALREKPSTQPNKKILENTKFVLDEIIARLEQPLYSSPTDKDLYVYHDEQSISKQNKRSSSQKVVVKMPYPAKSPRKAVKNRSSSCDVTILGDNANPKSNATDPGDKDDCVNGRQVVTPPVLARSSGNAFKEAPDSEIKEFVGSKNTNELSHKQIREADKLRALRPNLPFDTLLYCARDASTASPSAHARLIVEDPPAETALAPMQSYDALTPYPAWSSTFSSSLDTRSAVPPYEPHRRQHTATSSLFTTTSLVPFMNTMSGLYNMGDPMDSNGASDCHPLKLTQATSLCPSASLMSVLNAFYPKDDEESGDCCSQETNPKASAASQTFESTELPRWGLKRSLSLFSNAEEEDETDHPHEELAETHAHM